MTEQSPAAPTAPAVAPAAAVPQAPDHGLCAHCGERLAKGRFAFTGAEQLSLGLLAVTAFSYVLVLAAWVPLVEKIAKDTGRTLFPALQLSVDFFHFFASYGVVLVPAGLAAAWFGLQRRRFRQPVLVALTSVALALLALFLVAAFLPTLADLGLEYARKSK